MCVQLAVVALKAGQIVRIVLACFETALNFVVQFLLRSSMFKAPALAVPQARPLCLLRARGGGSGRLGTPGVEARPLGAPPPPRRLEQAASQVADSA